MSCAPCYYQVRSRQSLSRLPKTQKQNHKGDIFKYLIAEIMQGWCVDEQAKEDTMCSYHGGISKPLFSYCFCHSSTCDTVIQTTTKSHAPLHSMGETYISVMHVRLTLSSHFLHSFFTVGSLGKKLNSQKSWLKTF